MLLFTNWNWYYVVVPAFWLLSFLLGFLSWTSQDCQIQRRIPAGYFRLALHCLPFMAAFVGAFMIVIESYQGIMAAYLCLAPSAENDGWVELIYLFAFFAALMIVGGSSDGLLRIGHELSRRRAVKRASACRKSCQSQTPYRAMVKCGHKTMRCPCGLDDPQDGIVVRARHIRNIARSDGGMLVSQTVYLAPKGELSDTATDAASVPARLFIVPASVTRKETNQNTGDHNQLGA